MSGEAGDPEAARAALEKVCERYWLPARKFVQSLGCTAADAEDITQNFFAQWAHPEKLALLDPEKGRLRHYLKQSLRRFYISEWRKESTAKRGGSESPVSLDELNDLPEGASPGDAIYDAAWAEVVVRNTLENLEKSYRSRGREKVFQLIRAGLPGGTGLKPYAEIGVEVGMTEPQIKLEIHRVRRRFADRLREEVADTIADQDQLEDELRYLLCVMARTHGSPV